MIHLETAHHQSTRTAELVLISLTLGERILIREEYNMLTCSPRDLKPVWSIPWVILLTILMFRQSQESWRSASVVFRSLLGLQPCFVQDGCIICVCVCVSLNIYVRPYYKSVHRLGTCWFESTVCKIQLDPATLHRLHRSQILELWRCFCNNSKNKTRQIIFNLVQRWVTGVNSICC